MGATAQFCGGRPCMPEHGWSGVYYASGWGVMPVGDEDGGGVFVPVPLILKINAEYEKGILNLYASSFINEACDYVFHCAVSVTLQYSSYDISTQNFINDRAFPFPVQTGQYYVGATSFSLPWDASVNLKINAYWSISDENGENNWNIGMIEDYVIGIPYPH